MILMIIAIVLVIATVIVVRPPSASPSAGWATEEAAT